MQVGDGDEGVAAQLQHLQLLQLAYLRRQARELVEGQVQGLQTCKSAMRL